jgi:hypothetical protein
VDVRVDRSFSEQLSWRERVRDEARCGRAGIGFSERATRLINARRECAWKKQDTTTRALLHELLHVHSGR